MQSYGNNLQAYKEQSVYTMTPGEMLILLYDEIIKRMKKAQIYAKSGDYVSFERDLKKAQNIIHYLKAVLDRRYPVSMNLSQLYDFFNYQIIRTMAGRKSEYIDELLPLVTELRDTFKQADILSKQKA